MRRDARDLGGDARNIGELSACGELCELLFQKQGIGSHRKAHARAS